jgi:hypothetical protein
MNSSPTHLIPFCANISYVFQIAYKITPSFMTSPIPYRRRTLSQ